MTNKILQWVHTHKILTGICAVLLVICAWYAYSRVHAQSSASLYILGRVSSSTIISTVSGSGQVSPTKQVDIKPKVSGEVTRVLAQEGQKVSAGQAIAYIDSTSAQKNVRDAQANLESAQIALEKIKKPATALTLTQAQNALSNAEDELAKTYTDSQSDIVDAFLDLPEVLSSLQGIVIGTNSNSNLQWNIDYYLNASEVYDLKARTYRDTAYNDYVQAKKSYDTAFLAYQTFGQSPDKTAVEKMLSDTYTTTNLVAKALKSTNTFVQFYSDTMTNHNLRPSSVATSALTDLNTHIGTVNTHLSTLSSDTTALRSNAQTVTEKQQSLAETTDGPDSLDVQSAQLNVIKAENALLDAKNTLTDYVIRAPFAGTIASIDVQKGDTVSSATSAATVVTTDQIAELALNEVDAAKVEAGQKATLTLDAIEDLSIAGTVASVDTLGTVSQGVVSYTVKITFTTQDARVKPGMTANANIIVQTALDVLSVPASAVKTQNGQSYVQIFDPELPLSSEDAEGVSTKQIPQTVSVVTGISDDATIEIRSGLTLGQQIIVRSVTSASKTAATSRTTRGGFAGPPGL